LTVIDYNLNTITMNSFVKGFVLIAVVCVFVSHAAEEKEPRYSSFECVGYDKEHPENLAMRNCILHDVVIASEHAQPLILFYAREGQETPLLSADKDAKKGRVVEIAPRMYASVKVVNQPLPDDVEPMKDTAVIMTAQSNGFSQFLFDTFYSMYWMLSKTGDLNMTSGLVNNMSNITIVEVGRSNDYTKVAQGSLSLKAPAPLRYLKGVIFSNVVAGPAGHQLLSYAKGLPNTVEPDKKLLDLYRTFFIKVAEVKDEEFEVARVVISQRFSSHKLLNTEDLLTEMSKVGSVQVAFLDHLPIKSQVDLVGNSGLFVSIHSDDMAYMLFMRVNTIIVELFPYGIKSDLYKKLAEICGVQYYSWHSTDRSLSRFDAKILDKYPLTAEQKKKIIDSEKYDPSLPSGALAYWENQDTNVDINAVVKIVQDILPEKPENTGDDDSADEDAKQQKQEL